MQCKGHHRVSENDSSFVPSARTSTISLVALLLLTQPQPNRLQARTEVRVEQRETPVLKSHITTVRMPSTPGNLSKDCGARDWHRFPEISNSVWVLGLC